jgi:HAMP domain-containing protein/signal transduction histidine kinase/CheY-like chemotaxis protein
MESIQAGLHMMLDRGELLKALRAFRRGDFSVRMPSNLSGMDGEIAQAFNDVVEMNEALVAEIARVGDQVGREGQISQRVGLAGASGAWGECTEAVNTLIGDMVYPVTEVARVIGSVAKGDLSQTMVLEVDGRPLRGEALRLGMVVNTMVGQLNAFSSEVSRVAREVGTEGKLGGQALVPGVGGVWKDLTDNVNSMAANLTGQVRNIAEVTTAVAKGDLSKKITVDVKGEILELKSTINTMVDQLNAFAGEVSRVAKEVGTEGKLGGQAQVKGVGGVWKDLTDNVNSMAANLTGQVRNIADVATAIAKGDLSKKITVDVQGELLELKSTINTLVDQLANFSAEVTRVAREVGTYGKLGGQAQVAGVGGVWKDLTENVNQLAANLTGQVRNIAEVTTAVARGDLSKKITVDVRGEILELKSTINTMVDQLNSFSAEVTRVAREVGTEGKLGGQAQVPGVGGVWKDLTDNVNSMAANLTGQVRNIAEVTTAVARGDLSRKITVDVRGEILELKSTMNTMVDQLNAFAGEVSRVALEVGTEGRLGGQAQVKGVGGVWKDLTDNVNSMAANLTGQVRNIAEVTTAVAKGDLSKKITVDVKGELLELKSTINTMVDQLNAFASEVSRVAKEVGTEGKLGGQAQVKGVGGVWKDLTDNVNSMAANLTSQVRSVAEVVQAVASGDLERKLSVEAKGEVGVLADTINGMIDTLAVFAEQVTNVAREVGIEGKLGGQARVPGAAGLWRDLTDNVNRLAANLTSQVRAIAEVATAVTKGDLTRSITVEAQGEVASLKDTINEMIGNLKDTTRKNTEQDWLKTHLARFTRMLQGHRDLVTVSRLILSELTPLVNAQQAAFYVADHRSGDSQLELLAGYAQRHGKSLPRKIAFGEGLVGQCAFEKKRIMLNQAPSDYVRIGSALGSAAPVNIVILPVLFEGQVKAVIELASFSRFSDIHQTFLDQLTESIGVVLHTIAANMQTEYLLHQSQSLTAELQAQQEELKKTNDRLEQQALNLQKSESLLKSKQDELRSANEQLQEKARQLSEQMHQVEFKNREIEQARAALEEKAEQLSLSSRYKSEFLANMSHELRTPLNSLLILARLLADNAGGNLTAKQVEFAKTIHSSGAELLALINDILDLAKIESGTVTLNIEEERFADLTDYVERTFRQVAADKGLEFSVGVGPALPAALTTDAKRLQQIVTNLLSNAFKFTTKGAVSLQVERAASGWSLGHPGLDRAATVVAFSVIDTGIGIPASKQRLIFEAFQQADGTTSREYGGTGLGLSISRELARLLGGEIRVASTPGQGSTFTLYLPLEHATAGGESRRFETEELHMPELPVTAVEAEEVAPRASNELAEKRVLVVDDDIRNVFALTSALEQHGMQVLHAESGKEAIELLQEAGGVDLVLMDVMMPGLDGFDTMRIIRQLDGYKTLPIVAVTAKAMAGDRERCLEAGANDYIAKPVNVDLLLATLWRTLQGQPA